MLPPEAQYKPKTYNGFDTAADEDEVARLMEPYGYDWITTRARNKMERWDVEGYNPYDHFVRIETKTRTPNTYPSWIIDTYKVDYMLKHFPNDLNYYVNVCGGEFHLYDMLYIQDCFIKKNVRSRMHDGSYEFRDFYMFEKRNYLIELTSKELGPASETNPIFKGI